MSDPVGFVTAGRSVPPFWSGMAAAASALPASFLFALAGMLFLSGYDGLAFGLGACGGLALGAVLVAPRLRASGAATVPEYFGLRFGALARILAVAVLVLCSMVLLVAELTFAGRVAAASLGAPFPWMVAAALLVVLACALPGMRALTWVQVALYAALGVAILVPLFCLAQHVQGIVLPQIAYGEALAEITTLERTMLIEGVADARTLKPHVKPFLQIDAANVAALVLCLVAGAASLPHVLARHLTVRTVSDARFSAAWSLFFVFLLLVSIPAYAAYAKWALYKEIARGTELTALPPWVERASRNDTVRIHGVSLALLDDVIAVRRVEPVSAQAVARRLADDAPASFAAWSALKAPIRAALLDAAGTLSDASDAERWNAFRTALLPAAARAAGNRTGRLTQSAVVFDPERFVFETPAIAEAPVALSGLLVAGALAAAVATAGALAMAMAAALGRDVVGANAANYARGVWPLRMLLVAVAGLAAVAAVCCPPDPFAAAMAAFSLAAAALFPALVLGLVWKRTSGPAACVGMALGLGVALVYLAGTQGLPVAFFDASSGLSNASATAVSKFASLKSQWTAAVDGDAKALAWTALEAHARGTPLYPGVANWFGIHGRAAAIFALPVGFLAVVLLSLLIPARRESR